jgi:tetratricopeptide (TPR) repeat protein
MLLESGQYREAVSTLRLAVRAEPQNGELRLKLAEALLRAQDGEGHTETIRAADLLTDNLDVQLRAASSALALARFPDAVERASRVLREQSSNIEALLVLGNASARLPHSLVALQFLSPKARRIETYEAALRDLRPLAAATEDLKAEELFRRALEVAPRAFETRVTLVNFLWAAGRQDESTALLRELADERRGDLLLEQALARYYLSRGKLDEAEHYLKEAAETGDREASLELVTFYTEAGRDRDALDVLAGFADDEPPGSWSVLRAAIECRQGLHDIGLRRTDQVLARLPQHGQALTVRAECLFAMGRVADALQAARAAVAAAPASAGAHFVLGQVLSASGAREDAYAQLAEAVRLDPLHRPASRALARQALEVGRPAVALTLSRELVRVDANDLDAAISLVTALIRSRDVESAARELSALLKRYPSSAALLACQGNLHVARGTPGARAAYERALALDSDSLEALTGIVSLELKEKRGDAARLWVERALERRPSRPEYLVLLARVHETNGDPKGSEAAYRKALAIAPDQGDASLHLSALLERQQRGDEARAVLERLLAQRPGASDVRVALAALLETAGRTVEAEAHYQRVLADNPRAAVAAYRLASLYAERSGNLDVALDLAVTAVQELPDDPDANDALGWIHVRKNLPRLGLPHLESSVRAAPQNPTYRYHLGMAYIAMGQQQKGGLELERALALNPAFRFAPQARAALAGR